jgi:hypothetical protein
MGKNCEKISSLVHEIDVTNTEEVVGVSLSLAQ